MNEITIHVTQEDQDNKSDYLDSMNCLVATALKRQFPNSSVEVGTWAFNLDGEHFEFTGEVSNTILNSYIAPEDFQPFSFIAKKRS